MERTTAKIFIALSVVHIKGGTRAGLQLHADDSGRPSPSLHARASPASCARRSRRARPRRARSARSAGGVCWRELVLRYQSRLANWIGVDRGPHLRKLNS